MTSRDFCYWLQGFFEVGYDLDHNNSNGAITASQADMIKKHLAMVFQHEIDPSHGNAANRELLRKIHTGGDGSGKIMC
jgi:hypothetical protein